MIEIKCTQRQKDGLIKTMRNEGLYCSTFVDEAVYRSCDGDCRYCLEHNIKWNIQKEPLKPCPLCGGEAELIDTVRGTHLIICKNCGLETQNYIDKCNLIEAWNRRIDK